MPSEEPVVRLNLYDFLLLITRWWKLFLFNFIAAGIITSAIVLLVPVWYKATTVILPPTGGGSGLPSFLSQDLAGIASTFGLETPTGEIYQTILTSQTLQERLIERFHLRDAFKIPAGAFPEDVLRILGKRMAVLTREDQAIEVSFIDTDAQRAADLANGAVEELDNVYREITSKSAHNNRVYIGKRVAEINDSVAVLQDSLIAFQKSHKLISLSDQVQAMITAAAQLKAEQLSNDIQLNVMRNSFGNKHPQIGQFEAKSRELGATYDAILEGRKGDLFMAMQSIPEAGRQYGDLLRQIQIQSTVLEFIYPQYESARITEERETANVQILDVARTPKKKFKPPRTTIVLASCALTVFATLGLILLLEYWRKLPEKNARDFEKIKQVVANFKRHK